MTDSSSATRDRLPPAPRLPSWASPDADTQTTAVFEDAAEAPESAQAAEASAASTSPPPVPPERALAQEIAYLEQWAKAVALKGRLGSVGVAILRILALVGAAGAAAAGLLGRTDLMLPLCALGALSVAIHAALPTAGPATLQRRALCEIRELEHSLRLHWRSVQLSQAGAGPQKQTEAALQLLETVQRRREAISRYATAQSAPSSRQGG